MTFIKHVGETLAKFDFDCFSSKWPQFIKMTCFKFNGATGTMQFSEMNAEAVRSIMVLAHCPTKLGGPSDETGKPAFPCCSSVAR